MKIVDPDHIQTCEDSMFSTLTRELNMDTVLAALVKGADSDQIKISNGQLLPKGDEIVYQVDLSVSFSKRLIFDREGYLLDMDEKVPDAERMESQEQTYEDIFQENRDFWENPK